MTFLHPDNDPRIRALIAAHGGTRNMGIQLYRYECAKWLSRYYAQECPHVEARALATLAKNAEAHEGMPEPDVWAGGFA